MSDLLKLNLRNISIGASTIIFFASLFIYIGQLRGEISAQRASIDVLKREKLDVAVYEANHRNLYDIINLNKIKNDSEHESILKALEKIDTKLDKIYGK